MLLPTFRGRLDFSTILDLIIIIIKTPKTGANELGSVEIDREHPHVVNSCANPTRNPVTD